MTSKPIRDNAVHYNTITDAWKHIFGDNFHFGFFSPRDVSLSEATVMLIHEMANLGEFETQTSVLDVGCGIGSPAFYLHEKYGCEITGISTSQKGINDADEESNKRGYSDKVRFQVANGLDNGFPDESFDVVWVMESSHLMKDKKKLISECHRVLNPGGTLLLCDVMLKRRYTIADRVVQLSKLKAGYFTGSFDTFKAFGNSRVETMANYKKIMLATGFTDVVARDISQDVEPTIKNWKRNVAEKRDMISESFSDRQIDQFLRGADFMQHFFDAEITGYGLFKAAKP